MTTIIASLFDGAVVIALALAATILLRRRSAAIRHAILVTAVAAALVMPAFELALPLIPVIERAAPVYAVTDTTLVSDASASITSSGDAAVEISGVSWFEIAVAIWFAGAILILAGLAAGMIRLARIRARATPAEGAWRALSDELAAHARLRRPIALLQTADSSLLVTCGLLRPAIIIPAGASSWPPARIRNVLRHELAHIARHDAAIQTAAEVFRALHWINPLAWMLCRRLRQESEFACDDAVLSAGVKAEDYAGDLLAIARQLSPRRQWASAHAMAHPSSLERRIAAMLQGNNTRAALRRRTWIGAAAVALGISVPTAAAGIADPAPIEIASAPSVLMPAPGATIDVAAQTPRAALVTGTVVDQLGGVIPGAEVSLTDLKSRSVISTMTDAEGRFSFRDVPASEYQLTVRLAGFKTASEKVAMGPDRVMRHVFTLALGTLQESISVSCPAPIVPRLVRWTFTPTVHAQERPPTVVRVGGNVRAPRKLKDVKPVCPADMPAGDFTIQLTGRIDKEGTIQKLALDSSAAQPPVSLVKASLEAVRQWVFSPALLNRVPIDVDIAVRIVFTKK